MIKTGEKGIAWSSFTACSDRKKVVLIEKGTENIIGSTIEEVKIDKEKDLLFRTQILQFLDPNKIDRTVQLVLKWSTFEPISCSDVGPKNVTVHYEGDTVKVEIEGTRENVQHSADEGLFDLFSIELLLRLLPLELDYKEELRAFNHMVNDMITARIEVVKEENISDGTKEVAAWQVNVYLGGHLQTYWISKGSKQLLKQSIKLGEDVYFDFIR